MDAWSKSSLKSLLEGCAWQWALQKIGGLDSPPSPQSAAGTGVHHAIELYERSRIEGGEVPDLDTLVKVGREKATEESERVPETMWVALGLDLTAMETMVSTALTGWDATIRPILETYTPKLVEPYFRTDVGGVGDIHGYIDWFGTDADGHNLVVDYKTASSFSRWPDLMEGASIEAAVYLAGALYSDAIPADEPVRMEWHVMRTKGQPSAKIVKGPVFDEELLFFLAERLHQADAMVESGNLPKNTSWNLCSEKWCPFYHGCQVTGVLAPENLNLYAQTEQAATATPLAGAATVPPHPPSVPGA